MSSERACKCPLFCCSSDDPLQGWTVWPPDFSITHPPLANESKRLEVSLCRAPLRRWWLGGCCWLSSSCFGNFPAFPSVPPPWSFHSSDGKRPTSTSFSYRASVGSSSLPMEMSLFFFLFCLSCRPLPIVLGLLRALPLSQCWHQACK